MERLIQFTKEMLDRITEADVTGLSAQLAYFFLLSLFPFLLFLVTMLGYFPIDIEAVMGMLESYVPEEVFTFINSNLEYLVTNRSGSLLSISIIGTLWSASNGFNAVRKSFNQALRVEKERPFLIARVISIGLMILMVIVIVVALSLQVFGKVIGDYVFDFFGLSGTLFDSWDTLRWIVSSLTFFIVFMFLYKLGPDERVHLKHTIWGTSFATIAWQLTSLGFSYYVNTLGNYSAAYGSLGTVIILMFWFYLTGIIITTGGVINAYTRDHDVKVAK
ncbi:MAG TPA: YihY/virulence factor BrkB family protein [Pseudogracilibacillus sp.]|nr:YihY/virulence factor BrkB family protein [Pseudogracilibacillus sp.]